MMAGPSSAGDGGKKKKKGGKMELKETKPSEDALRVEPVVDADMKKRLATKEPKAKKEKKGKEEKRDPNAQKIDGFIKKGKVNGVKTEVKEEEVDLNNMD